MKSVFFALSLFFIQSAHAVASQTAVLPAVVSITVVFDTTFGQIEVELNSDQAPITVQNFLNYVDSGFYNQTLFHRVIKNFVIQGGGLDLNMNEKPTLAEILNEAQNGLSNIQGTIAMARTEVVNSATSQFFINTVNNVRLDYQSPQKYGYAVFGKVISGFDVVQVIEAVTTQDQGDYDHVPLTPVILKSITRK